MFPDDQAAGDWFEGIRWQEVMGIVEPLWTTKRETAQRILQRITIILDWCVANGHLPSNPAQAVLASLPKQRKAVQHHQALHASEFRAKCLDVVLASQAAPASKLAFEFIALTAARSGEVRLAEWSEFDLDQGLWTVPASRMKAKREHRVPLSTRAIEILMAAKELPLCTSTELVFPSPSEKAMSDNTLSKLLRENGVESTVHGIRSTFRDWCAETAKVPFEVAESALAHVISNAAVAAYARTDHLDARRDLMQTWCDFLAG